MDANRTPDDLFYVVSVCHTKRGDQFITFWRENNAGYAYPLSWAGKYPRCDIRQNYHNDGEATIAVRTDAVDAIAEPTPRGWVDGDAGPIVYHNRKNWKALLAAVITEPAKKPKPQFPPRRKAA